MTEAQLLQEGLNLMLAGMGFVLVFLGILIYAIGFISKVIERFFPTPTPVQTASQPASLALSQVDDIERLRPVIVAAVAHYRRQQGLQ
ncbi:oxaloacetate decarboxylase subunit gamma [Conservatibacter flavescens]|uniref:Probable oxaloacetate decarboxylase gamma chain n=1 Tax=Conservatibacter flavescens TaxID=28161 RepID=A0A2M8S334_9PAST|nr:oxaloacetate decarboxylase subunit gamma [Conservatibacter flavescens]PJG85517.1 oxaloacetate decarboxylase gamma chain [Conservatibacter flavescens]